MDVQSGEYDVINVIGMLLYCGLKAYFSRNL